MGFERLVRVIQGKTSNYDTDVFMPTIIKVQEIVGYHYHPIYSYHTQFEEQQSIAFRVIADHIRAISFTIADGQLPASNGAGYVIRRILRRAVRYYFSFLNYKQPLLHQLVPLIANQFATVFPELKAQEEFVKKVILEEENGFLRTLENGLKRLDEYVENTMKERYRKFNEINSHIDFPNKNVDLSSVKDVNFKESIILNGKIVFELSDTFGFPLDLTQLIASEKGFTVDVDGFNIELQKQKDRSRKAAVVDTDDWIELDANAKCTSNAYTKTETTTKVIKYRKVSAKGKTQYQIVLEETPFYAESGGQVGDTGRLVFSPSPNGEGRGEVFVTDTKKENDLIIHFVDELPEDLSGEVVAKIDASRRRKITRHHSVTHLMQAAMREVLGTHVAQKGSLNTEDNLRFDFSHFAKVTDEEIAKIEILVNRKIRQNIPVIIKEMPKEEAMKLGAMALFGEKYGDTVRVVIMDENFSIELCGGTHVMNTGELNIFKIISESAVAAGVRRFEALAGCKAEAYIMAQLKQLNDIKTEFKNPKDLLGAIKNVQDEKTGLQKQLERLEAKALIGIRNELLTKIETINGKKFIGQNVEVSNADALRKICTDLKNEIVGEYIVCLTANIGGKSSVAVSVNDNSIIDATKVIKEHVAPLIKGGGGGQKTLATAGGQDASQLAKVIEVVKGLL